jgi:nucleotide-binding universal stress UspA family protein
MKILVPIDGSAHSVAAVRHLIEHAGWFRDQPTVDLVCVQPPLPTRLVHMALSAHDIERYYQEEGTAALAMARSLLEQAGIAHSGHILVGAAAESIVEQSRKSGSDLILVATRGIGAAGSPLLGSTAVRILHLSTTVPVLVVNCGMSF